jgi:hypothetical protein
VIHTAKPSKEKITVSIDADILRLVDTYVQDSKESGVSRSSVFEQALHLWKQAMRDSFDERYYSQNAQSLKDDSWSAVTTEAAKHIWKSEKTPHE